VKKEEGRKGGEIRVRKKIKETYIGRKKRDRKEGCWTAIIL
jgi:hypothetical protein